MKKFIGIIIKPHIGGCFTYASASLDTYYGKVSNSWKIENGNLLMDVEIPANTTATVFVPAQNADAIKESGKILAQDDGIKVKGTEEDYVELELGSGVYHFVDNKFVK